VSRYVIKPPSVVETIRGSAFSIDNFQVKRHWMFGRHLLQLNTPPPAMFLMVLLIRNNEAFNMFIAFFIP